MSDPQHPVAPAPSTQRRLMLGAAAAIVGTAGLGAGLWLAARREAGPANADNPADMAGEALPPDFWTHQFDTPTGGSISLASLQGKPLLINFWATWCPPCVKEMPELQQFADTFGPQGWQVLGLAIDGPTPVKEFLAKTPVRFPIGLAGFGGTELSSALGNTAGGLPFSVMIDQHKRLRQRKMGATHFAELSQWAKGITDTSR